MRNESQIDRVRLFMPDPVLQVVKTLSQRDYPEPSGSDWRETLSLGQRLEPVGDFIEAFFARRLGHAGIHIGIFVRLAGYGCLQVRAG